MEVVKQLEELLAAEEVAWQKYSQIDDDFGNEDTFFEDFLDETFVQISKGRTHQKQQFTISENCSTDDFENLSEIESPTVKDKIKRFQFGYQIQQKNPAPASINNSRTHSAVDVPRWKRWNSEKSDSITNIPPKPRQASVPTAMYQHKREVHGN